jgi:hypothetical protein
MVNAPTLWLGPSPNEARAAYGRARESGMSALRALVVGNIASHRDCWAFRAKLAQKVGCSVRTVQRAITQATSLGLIGVARAKPNEKPPGVGHVVPCGWSHRWTVGWGRAGAAVKRAVDAARARFTLRRASRPLPRDACAAKARQCGGKAPQLGRTWTAAELDAELALVPRTPNVPERPPPE